MQRSPAHTPGSAGRPGEEDCGDAHDNPGLLGAVHLLWSPREAGPGNPALPRGDLVTGQSRAGGGFSSVLSRRGQPSRVDIALSSPGLLNPSSLGSGQSPPRGVAGEGTVAVGCAGRAHESCG